MRKDVAEEQHGGAAGPAEKLWEEVKEHEPTLLGLVGSEPESVYTYLVNFRLPLTGQTAENNQSTIRPPIMAKNSS